MNTITKTLTHAGVIAGAALMLTAMSILPIAGRAHAQDTSEPEASSGASSPDAVIDVTGNWSGSVDDSVEGEGTLTLSLVQAGRDLKSGSGWTVTFNNSTTSPEFVGGMANGSKVTEKSQIILKLVSASFDKKSCRVVLKSTSASDAEIEGTYKYVNCGKQFKGNKGGSFSVTSVPAS
jgi:hypothetical protein